MSEKIIASIHAEIASNNLRRLNWRGMKYFIKRQQWAQAAQCRDRVGCWNKNGPLPL